MQLVNYEILDPGRDRQPGCEFIPPKLTFGYALAIGQGELFRDCIEARDETAALRSVKLRGVTREMLAVRIGAATADLTTGEDVGPINDLPLRILDAIHVRRAFERGEIGDRFAFPEPVRIALKLKYRASGIDSIAVVGDVSDARFSEDNIDVLSIRRPYGKPQVRSH
jgi:hypothetical protein